MRQSEIRQNAVAHAWGNWIDPLRRLVSGGVAHYRPEKHYMRGPGPKWREKHADAPAVGSWATGERLG